MKHLLTLAATAGLSLALVGCGAQSGQTMVQYEKGDTGDKIVPAFGTGTAALYSGNDLTPEVRVPIEKGEDVGFRDNRSANGEGTITAVAADYKYDIKQGTIFDREYYWKFQGGKDD